MRVAVLANLKKNAPTWEGMPDDQWDDLDSEKTPNSIVSALQSGGHEAAFFEASILSPHDLVGQLQKYRPDLCFNIAEGHFGDSRESQIPAILEMLRIPYTGSKLLTLALALDKPMTKRILTYHGLPTPEFMVFERPDDPIDDDLLNEDGELRYTMFVKPSREGTSVGVSADSIVHTVDQLRARIEYLQKRYNQPVLCEHFVEGRDVTIGMVGNLGPREARRVNERTASRDLPRTIHFFPPLEVDLAAYDPAEGGIYSSRLKVDLADTFYYKCPAPLSPAFLDELNLLAAAVFRVTGCLDLSRVDLRLDADNNDKPYILEINPLPGLNPGYSDLCIEAETEGWSYERLINTIVEVAAIRCHLKSGDYESVLRG